ncbi:hypothetical protein FKR81_01740 [Lentzea tibetensis]|uniref:Uncharacterized protein n=1 Tax=Lentzea tibetensis TaxID=2591470 RepID=A0A563F2X3_9PSEU|nr:hypothetical protein [Lentzea tibetensis]TWP54305.1 hypothetical protein FKR81_01740 [Lentzea tibetensis]
MNQRVAWLAVIAALVLAGGIVVARSVMRSSTTGVAVVTVPSAVPTQEPPTTTIATSTLADPDPDRATEMVQLIPVDRTGTPAAGYTVLAGEEVSNCGQSSAGMDSDIVMCVPSAARADVCWVTPNRTTLLCGTTPWEKTLKRMTSTAPVVRVAAPTDPVPWGLELADGAKCQVRNGGSWPGRADGLNGAYYCDRDGEFVLIDDTHGVVNRSQEAWTAIVGGLGDNNQEFPPPVKVRVVKAYFASYATG